MCLYYDAKQLHLLTKGKLYAALGSQTLMYNRGVLKHSFDRPDQVEIGKDELIQKSARPSDEYDFPHKIPPINIIIHCCNK